MSHTSVERSSNFELFRIILMIIIVAHHYVVNSGVLAAFQFDDFHFNTIFLQFFGFGGKIGINCFLLITGYFMIDSRWRLSKAFILLLDIWFYRIVMYGLMVCVGVDHFSLERVEFLFTSWLFTLTGGRSFPEVFLMLYLMIPLINKVINYNKRELMEYFILIMLCYYTVMYTALPFINRTIHYLGWFITMYFIGAYIRKYSFEWFDNTKRCYCYCALSLFVVFSSILVIDWMRINSIGGVKNYYYNVIDSYKMLAVISSVLMFLVFRNIKLKNSSIINWMATSTLSILLIHANSDAVRKWLWGDILDVKGHYNDPHIIIYSIASVLGVYICCLLLDKICHFIVLTRLKESINSSSILSRIDKCIL